MALTKTGKKPKKDNSNKSKNKFYCEYCKYEVLPDDMDTIKINITNIINNENGIQVWHKACWNYSSFVSYYTTRIIAYYNNNNNK